MALAMAARARPVTLRVTSAPGSGLNGIGLMPPSMTRQGRAVPDTSAVIAGFVSPPPPPPQPPTVGLSAFGQPVQGDQGVDLARTKGCRIKPEAIPQARLVGGLPLTMTCAFGILA